MNQYKKQFEKMNVKFQSLAASTIIVFMIAWLWMENTLQNVTEVSIDNAADRTAFLVLAAVIIIGLWWQLVFRKSLNQIPKETRLSHKIENLDKALFALVLRYSILSYVISIVYVLLKSQVYIAIYALILVGITVNRVTMYSMASKLRLSKEEREELYSSS